MTRDISVIPLSTVGEDDFREGITEEADPTLRAVIGRITMSVVTIVTKSIHSSFCA
jgi:hypothetical protein